MRTIPALSTDLTSQRRPREGLFRAAILAVQLQWRRHAEREGIETPTVWRLTNFLMVQYDIEWSVELTARFAGVSDLHDVVDMETVVPRIADMLLDSRLGPMTKL